MTAPSPAQDRMPSNASQGEPASAALTAIAVAALLCIHASVALWAVAGKSVTADEILHVTGGYFHNRFGDYRIHPENGILPQRLHGLAAVLRDAPPPRFEGNVYWRTSDASVVGHQFFYETDHDHFPMLMGARALNLLFSVATGLLVYCWARRLFGTAAGLFSLTLFALDPTMLAHGPLATSDAAAAFFLLASSGAFWSALRSPSPRRVAGSALVFGLACVAKYSAVLLLPVFLILLLVQVATSDTLARRRWLWFGPVLLAVHGAGAIAIIWLFYGFRYGAFAPHLPPADHFIAPWETLLPSIGLHGTIVGWCRELRLLPEAFLYGYAWVIQSAKLRSAFLAGEYSIFGWTSFFPLAFWWKTTSAVLAATAAALVALLLRWARNSRAVPRDLWVAAPLLVFGGIYWVFSLTSHLNIGHRHILPTYPVLFILLGGLMSTAPHPPTRRRLVAGAVIVSQAAACAMIAPHFLAFFNIAAGGPANGHRLLVDSSLDWGQDLPALKKWLTLNNTGPASQPVFLSYFGSGEPDYYGISATRLPFVNGFKIRHPWYEPSAGIYAISATMLQQVYSPHRGPWSLEQERRFQELRTLDPGFRAYARDPSARGELLKNTTAEEWWRAWNAYDLMRFARLCQYLRVRKPDAEVGYSILIFRLTDEELDAAIRGSMGDLADAMERAAH